MMDGIVKTGTGLVERYVPPLVGLGVGWGVGELILQKVDLPARLAFAIPKSVLKDGQERQDMTDLIMFGVGAGLVLAGLGFAYRGVVDGKGLPDRVGNSALGTMLARLGIAFINATSIL